MDANKEQSDDLQVGRRYDKFKYNKLGNAGIEGTSFQIDLLIVCLLNATEKYPDWRLSTENEDADKFDDIVFESLNGDTLVQCKWKKHETKITFEDLFSTNSKNDFSLAKYLCSYLFIKTGCMDNVPMPEKKKKSDFKIKNVILCTNAKLKLDEDTNSIINVESITTEHLLHIDGADKICYTFTSGVVTKLKESAEIYYRKNLQKKSTSVNVISTENILEFLQHFQFITNCPSGKQLQTIIENMLSKLHHAENLDYKASSTYIREKIKDWFQLLKESNPKHLKEVDVKAMFCELRSKSNTTELTRYDISYKQDALSFIACSQLEKVVLHIIPEENYILTAIKVYQALQKEDVSSMLFLNLNNKNNIVENFMESFKILSYKILVIVFSETVEENVAQKIYDDISEILSKYEYKQIILVSGKDNIVAKKIKSANIYKALTDKIVFTDLTKETREKIRQKKSVVFQGKDMSLEDLHLTDEILAPEMLLKILERERIKVGCRLSDEHLCNHYVHRKFVRDGRSFPEEEICNLDNSYDDDIIMLISDSAGMGKTTVLTHLSMLIKNTHPYLWVVKVDLNKYVTVFSDYHRKNITNFDIMDLLDSQETTTFTSSFEKKLFLMPGRVVLMVDGVDEIVPNYTDIVFSFLKGCKTNLKAVKQNNLKKIFITTRPHLREKLEKALDGVCFSLEPFSKQNQIDFLKRYWFNELKLQEKSEEGKCEMYAIALITAAARWMDSVGTFCGIPLQMRMLAEIFQERKDFTNGDMEDWDDCIEFVNSNKVIPKLPQKINLVELYEMFIDKKRTVFVCEKGNSGRNILAEEGVTNTFNECYDYHCILALQTVLSGGRQELLCFYKKTRVKNIEERNLLKVGIVQKEDGQLLFIHKTFAEYFVAELLLAELQCNFKKDFQNFLIEEIFCDLQFNVVRTFLDNMLQKQLPSLPQNTLKAYSYIKWKPKLDRDGSLTDIFLHVLSEEGHIHILRFLFKCLNFTTFTNYLYRTILNFVTTPTNINVKGRYGMTALHMSALNGHLDVVKLLVEKNADIDIKDNFKRKPVYCALEARHLQVVKFLVENATVNNENEVDYTVIYEAARQGCLDIVRCLVESGMNIKDTPGGLALHFAALHGQLHIVEYLLESGTDVNIKGDRDRTALHYAAAMGHIEVMKLLIKKGADVNITNVSGCTALHSAVEVGKLNAVKCLVENGADVNVSDTKGRTALHEAARKVALKDVLSVVIVMTTDFDSTISGIADNEPIEVFKFLIDKGAKIETHISKALSVTAQRGLLDRSSSY